MWPGFDSRTRCHMWVEFVVGSRLARRVFLRFSGFPPSTKINTSKYQFDLETVDDQPLCGNATANSHYYYIVIIIIIIIIVIVIVIIIIILSSVTCAMQIMLDTYDATYTNALRGTRDR